MNIVQNFPAISIMIAMFSAIICAVVSNKASRNLTLISLGTIFALSVSVLLFTVTKNESYVYVMGKFPAPWGNELRVGVLECMLAVFFAVIMLLSILGGRHKLTEEVEEDKIHLYYVLTNLIFASILALVYTNDMFTAYVFVEINTISAAGLIMIRHNERTIEAAVRYMIMSLLGSGLLLMGICMLYNLTGHILMSSIHEKLNEVLDSGAPMLPFYVTVVLLSIGLCVKSALFPFHAWLPNAYGYSTVSSGAILSSIVSKGYIFLLIKIIFRVIGFDNYVESRIVTILFVFGILAMIFGSVSAIGESDIRRMIAFSSVAQIGYIYMGIGLGTKLGVVAAIFHIMTHGATKSLLFISTVGLTDASGKSKSFADLTGAALRNKIAGAGFAAGAFSMVGIPLFSGFISKLLFSQAAIDLIGTGKMLPVLIVLGVSTILNAMYFMKTVLRIFTPTPQQYEEMPRNLNRYIYTVSIIVFIIVNLYLGLNSAPVVDNIMTGLDMFA